MLGCKPEFPGGYLIFLASCLLTLRQDGDAGNGMAVLEAFRGTEGTCFTTEGQYKAIYQKAEKYVCKLVRLLRHGAGGEVGTGSAENTGFYIPGFAD